MGKKQRLVTALSAVFLIAWAESASHAQSVGGAGGDGSAGQPLGFGGGGNGGALNQTGGGGGNGTFPGPGGGGGGGGGPGGAGGNGGTGDGGAVGGAAGMAGADTTTAGFGGGGGGGGGNGGGAGDTASRDVEYLFGAFAGGAGSTGGAGGSASSPALDGGGGGGGGAGGYGVLINGAANVVVDSSAALEGGNGGNGGNGGGGSDDSNATFGGNGGSGGDGGAGLYVIVTGVSVTNSGIISGGQGGAGGTGGTGFVEDDFGGPGTNGAAGGGGTGIIGSDLTIINSGSIAGGMNGTGTAQADAIKFTDTVARASTLEITSTSVISGNVVDAGGSYNFVLGGTTRGSFNTSLLGTQYQNVGNFQLNAGNATTVWTLTGTNAYTGPVEITKGILDVTTGTLDSASALTLDGGTLQAGGALVVSNATTLGTGTTSTLDSDGNALTYSGAISGAGGLVIADSGGGGSVIFSGSGANTYTGATTISGGTLEGGAAGAFSPTSATTVATGGTLDLGGFAQTVDSVSLAGGAIQNGALTGAITSTGGTVDNIGGGATLTTTAGTTDLGANTYSGGTTLTGGTAVAGSNTAFGTGAITFNGGTLQAGGNFTLANAAQVTSAGGTIDTAGQLLSLNGDITDGSGGSAGTLNFISTGATGTIILNGTNTYSAATVVQSEADLIAGSTGAFSANSDYTVDGDLALGGFSNSIRSLSGTGVVQNSNTSPATLTIADPSGTYTFSGAISDGGAGALSLVKDGAGTQVLSGANTYTGATTVNGGTLEVDGSITSTSGTTVSNGTLTVNGTLNDPTINSGGVLNGTGSVGDTTINSGGTFAPGNGTPGTSETVNGNLTLASGSTYQIYLNPTTSSLANVTGTAALGGTVAANFASGSYISKTYTILTTTGGVSGAFSGVTNVNLPTNFTDKLSTDAKNAYLNLTLNFVPPPPPPPPPPPNPPSPPSPPSPPPPPVVRLNQNQLNVANTLVNYFNTNGGIPTKFGTLPGAALSQIDGEGNTGAERAAIQLESEFLSAMLDPFADGRFGDHGAPVDTAGNNAQPLGYTAEEVFMPRAMASAYSRFLKEPPAFYVPHWTAWGAAYGGVSITSGNAETGSNRLNADTFGFAGGMDYHVSADTIVGFALGGGGTNWNLASVSGSGHSTALQAGVYALTRAGPLYGAAAFGFTNNWFDTNRTALGDQLHANFGGQSYGGRLEEGYRLRGLLGGVLGDVIPYSAIQAQAFQTPTYSENDITSGGFGLSYASMGAVDVRTEIGARFEDVTTIVNMPLALRGKLAWAHDFADNPWLNASFQSLPGTGFIVNGAPIPHNSALVSGGAELYLARGWSVLAKFDGEFAGNSDTYGGTGTLRYTW